MLKSITAVALIGLLGGFCAALLSGNIEIFRNYVEGAWRYEVAFKSPTELIIGAVIGLLAGTNIGFALSPKRIDAFYRGAGFGAAVGILLVLAQTTLVALAATLGSYYANYHFLLTRFAAIITAAAIVGAIAVMLAGARPLIGAAPGALVGLLTAVAFVLPGTILLAVNISNAYPNMPFGEFAFTILNYVISQSVILPVGAGCGAIVGAVSSLLSAKRDGDRLTSTAIILGAVIGVTASSLSFLYILNLALSYPTSTLATIFTRIALGLFCGAAVGIAIIALKTAATRPNPDMIDPD